MVKTPKVSDEHIEKGLKNFGFLNKSKMLFSSDFFDIGSLKQTVWRVCTR